MKKISILILFFMFFFVTGCVGSTRVVTFNSNGGTPVEQITVGYGKTIDEPTPPTKVGYEFEGWYLNDELFSFETKIVNNIILDAKWESTEEFETYVVIFADFDGTILSEQEILEGEDATPPANPTRNGYKFIGWDREYTDVQENLFVYALYEEVIVETFSVIFKDYDGKILKEEEVEFGNNATAPANPKREGYIFIGWDNDYVNVQADLIITAVYEEDLPEITYYQVVFKDYDGKVLKTESVEEGKNATAPKDPQREGYTFTGRDKAYTNVKGDLTVTATYQVAVKTYTVKFNDYNGVTIKSEVVEVGKSATAPADPIRSGYVFVGWNTDFSNVKGNLTVTATYVSADIDYNINYNLNGGIWGYSSKTEYITAFLSDFYNFVSPSESIQVFMHGEGKYTGFGGTWSVYIGGVVGEVNKLLYENNGSLDNEDYFFNCSQYKAKWANLVEWVAAQNHRFNGSDYTYGALDFQRYIIDDPAGYLNIYGEKFHSYPNVNEPTVKTFKYSATGTLKLHTPLNPAFKGWYLNSDLTGTPVTEISLKRLEGIDLYASWDQDVTYEVYFDTDGAGNINPVTVQPGDKITLPSTLSKEGYTFLGWYLGEERVESSFEFNYSFNITLKAKWRSNTVELVDLVYNGSAIKYRNTNTTVQIPSEYVQPEVQLRAAWVTSHAGNFTPSPDKATMKANLLEVLEIFEAYKLNCIIFHIRTLNNAFYKTDLAPMDSRYGTFEDWDYLEWFIEECHSRGIEFHAWLNPYRIQSYGYAATATADTVAKEYAAYPKNPASKAENILMTYRSDGTQGAILNPYKKEVKDHIVDVCLEVMENYNVDAIHFDDYFYAQMSSGITVLTEPDQDDYEAYIDANPSCGYSKTSANNKKQWRRDNVDSFIKQLSDAMTAFNKEKGRGVQLGISPTGIYRNGNGNVNSGSNTAGQEHYNSYLFCDTKKWIDNEWIDYIMPQTYWAFSHSIAGYADVLDWWNKVVEGKNVNLYSGIGIYMSVDGGNYSWGTQQYEVSNQILYTTKLKNVKGVSFYSYLSMKQIHENSSKIAYNGLMRIKNEYWISTVATPKVAASQYIK